MQNNQVYFKDIRNKIIEQIQLANSEILIAVAWLTDEKIITTLEEVAKRKIKIKIVFYDDKINRKDLFKDLFFLNAEIKSTPKLMHNKFCIIDKSVVINGSYNWTCSARTNHENITINYGNDNLTHEFITEFNNIFHSATKIDQYFKSIDSQFEEYLCAQPFPLSFPVFICQDNTYNIIQELKYEKSKRGFHFLLIKDEIDFTTYHQYIFNRQRFRLKFEFVRLGLQIFKEIYDYDSTTDDLIKANQFLYFTNKKCLVTPHNSHASPELFLIDKAGNKVSKSYHAGRVSLYPEIISIDYTSSTGIICDKDLNEIDYDYKKITQIREKWIISNESFSSSNQSYLFYGLLDTKFRVLLPNIFHKLIEERNDKIIFESHPLYAKYNKIKTLENPINTPAEKRLFYSHLEVLALRFEYNFLTKKLTQVTFNPLSKNYYYLTGDNGIYADFYKLRLSNLKISEVEEMKNYFFVNKLLNNKKELEKHFNAKIQSIQQKDQNNSQNCYIATLAYQNIDHPQVEYLRNFRDNRLVKIYLGKVFIKLYYRFSPSLVDRLGNKPTINYFLRTFLNSLIKFLKIFYINNSL